MGLNLTVSRLASVVGGIITPRLIQHDIDDQGYYLINSVMYVGTAICIVSLFAGIMLVLIDSYADKKDKDTVKLALTAEDKFKW